MNLPLVSNIQGRVKGVYYGWWVLLATFLLGTISGGIFSHANGIYFGPIKADLGLTSAQTAIIFSMARAEGSVAGPIVGRLVDKFGSRPMIIVGGLVASLGFILLHWVHAYWLFVLVFVGIVSTGKSSGLGQTLMSAANRWFVARRSLAMAIVVTGFASGGAAILPLISLGVNTIGWRDVMLYSGIFMAIIVVPLGMLVRHSPERMGIQPEGLERPTGGEGSSTPGRQRRQVRDINFTVREALNTRVFWSMLAATSLRVTLWGAVSVHAVEMMKQEGMSPQTAGFMFSLMFLLSIPFRLGVGALGMRLPLTPMLFGGMAAAGLGMVALLIVGGTLGVVLFVALMALEQGAGAMNFVAMGDYFGRLSFSTLFGIMSTCFNIGMLVSPIYAGWIADTHNGSYTVAYMTFIPMYFVAGFIYLGLRPPPLPPRLRGTQTGGAPGG